MQRLRWRGALGTWVGFVLGSLIVGGVKGNSFADNLVYGLWTGAIAGAAYLALGALLASRR